MNQVLRSWKKIISANGVGGSIKKEKFVIKYFLDNFESSSEKLKKIISANGKNYVKQQ